MLKTSFLSAAAIAALVTVTPNFASAQIAANESGVNKINVSGRQRMLSQRMTKAACFSHIGIGADAHRDQMRMAHQLFTDSLEALMKGQAGLGINEETDPAILAELELVAALWEEFGPLVAEAINAGAVDRTVLEKMKADNLELLRQANEAVKVIEARYAAGVINPALAGAVNVSGRQRMLSQRAAKEYCFIVAGIAVEENRAALAKTIELFDTSLAKLRNGDKAAGITPPLDDDMKWQYEAIQELWDRYAPLLRAALTDVPSTSEAEIVAGINNAVLVEMNVAVGMYSTKD